MSTHQLRQTGGWAALIAGLIGLLTVVSLLLFFTFEIEQANQDSLSGIDRFHLFGFLSDILPIFAAPAALVVVAAVYQLQRAATPRASALAALLGITGNLLMAVNSILFVSERITLTQQTYLFYITMAPLGLWHILVNTLARRDGLLPAPLTMAGIAVGMGQILIFAVLYGFGAYDAAALSSAAEIMADVPLLIALAVSVVSFLLGYIGAPLWLVWLGRALIQNAERGEAMHAQVDIPAFFQG